MGRFLLSFILIIAIYSCQKEDITKSEQKKDYTSFLRQSVWTFRGKLNENYFSWSFGVNDFSSDSGSGTDTVRIVDFGLTQMGGDKWFQLYSPKYNAASANDFMRVFGLGK